MGKMQYTMMNSDTEDQLLDVTNRLKSITDQGSELGKLIAGIDSEIDNGRSAIRQLQAFGMQYTNNPNNPKAQQGAAMVKQRILYFCQNDVELRQRKNLMDTERKVLANQEKHLNAQKTHVETMKKFSDGAMQKFQQMEDGAIKRMVG
jgi:septal ring factor EnvC (AmiA/AmiB activator)